MPKVHCLQHAPFEGMAVIEEFLIQNHFEISFTRFYISDFLPDPSQIDWLVIMGGPMSVNDHNQYPWLIEEKRFISRCIQEGKIVIGVCLGAQLIARALGAKVYQNEYKEIGWFPIFKNSMVSTSLIKDLPENLTVFHWHGETFDLPAGTKLIASSKACAHQIFMLDQHVLGMQCHLEIDHSTLKGFLKNCENELNPSLFVQSQSDILQQEVLYRMNMNNFLLSILSKFPL